MSFFSSLIKNDRPYLIAEIGVNYYDIASQRSISPIEAAKLMVKEALESGCQAVKFQTYKAEKIASKFSPAYWDQTKEPSSSQYELFKKFDHFGEAEYKELSEYTLKLGGVFLSTPFDFEAVDMLDDLMPFFKISSSDLSNYPMLKHIASKKKPVIFSNGASTLEELIETVEYLKSLGINDIVVMHCILSYPTKYSDLNFSMFDVLKRLLPDDILIGFSDHSPPDHSMLPLTLSYLEGVRIIEKHFTLDKGLQGNDHYHAMDPEDVKCFFRNIDLIKQAYSPLRLPPLECEMKPREMARRSIVAARNLKKGEIVQLEDLTFKRPGSGISPKEVDSIVGKIVNVDIEEDKLILWDMLK